MEARTPLVVPDRLLVERVRLGDVEAFAALYDRYAREVYLLAVHALGRADAEEVVQDAFLRLWQRAHQFDPARGSFVAWFMTIARNRMVDELHRRRNGPDAAEAVDKLFAEAPDPTVDLEEEASVSERRVLVLQALKGLPPDQRRVLVLAYFGGLSQAAIADHLGVPLGTVKKRVRLGVRKLRASLAGTAAVEDRERSAAS